MILQAKSQSDGAVKASFIIENTSPLVEDIHTQLLSCHVEVCEKDNTTLVKICAQKKVKLFCFYQDVSSLLSDSHQNVVCLTKQMMVRQYVEVLGAFCGTIYV